MGYIFMLRHGETEGNAKKIYRGRWDLPLNDRGKTQAHRAAEALSNFKVSAILTSPLRRAWETAEAVGVSRKSVDVIEEELLIDIDYGEWTKRPATEIETSQPERHRAWYQTPEDVVFPGGEGLSDVRKRIESLFSRLGAQGGDENILLVSHRVPIKVALCFSLGLQDSAFWRIDVDTASISAIMLDGDNIKLAFSNETCHLGLFTEKLDSIDF